MAQRVRMTYCGMDGEGSTLTAAKQDAARQVERFLDEISEQKAGFIGKYFCLTYRTKTSWYYSIYHPGEPLDHFKRVAGHWCCSATDAEDAERCLRKHVAQWIYGETDDKGLALLEIHNDKDRQSIAHWCDWQAAYRIARAQGMNDQEAREAANRAA
jgi:hypothetical protein